MKLNAQCTRIEKTPDISHCDLVIVTHMFGQDLHCSLMADFKLRTKCIMMRTGCKEGHYPGFLGRMCFISVFIEQEWIRNLVLWEADLCV